MIESKIIWHKADEELPENSCRVVVICVYGDEAYACVSDVNYSLKHKSFNCNDDDIDSSTTPLDNVKYWTYANEFFFTIFKAKKEKDR